MDSDPRVRDSHVLFIGPLGHCILGSPHHPIYMLGEAQGFLQAMAVASLVGAKEPRESLSVIHAKAALSA